MIISGLRVLGSQPNCLGYARPDVGRANQCVKVLFLISCRPVVRERPWGVAASLDGLTPQPSNYRARVIKLLDGSRAPALIYGDF